MWNWYQLFSLPEFLEAGLTSQTLSVSLTGIGEKDILITRGINIGIVYEETFLVLGVNEDNPYIRDGFGIYKDAEENIWLGVEQ